ncbi:MAG: hypothetical protein CL916_15055 [Deltaproteobacteria bacterium]|nr:hypothetical protein [Deltaproteobacteria bacterium]
MMALLSGFFWILGACADKETDTGEPLPDPLAIDDDGDGFTEKEGDCDDIDAFTFPGSAEREAVFACMTDADGDGWGAKEPVFGVAAGTDCDDLDAAMNNDDVDGDGLGVCDGDCDDSDARINFTDHDGDGFHTCAGDCDDDNPLIHPGAAERESSSECMLDADGDGWGDSTPPNGVVSGIDCDDSDARLNHSDLDGDGYVSCVADCDDSSAFLTPEDNDGDGSSTCDGDCNDSDASLNRLDEDGDGFTSCVDDCNDQDNTVYPNAQERCDGQHNNCFDEDYDPSLPPIPERDVDGDGSVACSEDGSIWKGLTPADGYSDCDDMSAVYNQSDTDADGFSTCDDDCNDSDAFVYPGAAYLDSTTECMRDFDGDGYGEDQSCCYTLEMNDSWGDGWNGGYVTAYENNISIGTYSVSENGGASETASICISDGSSFLLQYTAGTREEENSYTLFSPDGATLVSDGPSPTTGDVYGTYLLWSSQTSCVVKLNIASGTDCDDSLSSVSPISDELYGDEIDNNCNGIIDGQTDISSAQIEYRGEEAGDRLGSIMSAVRDVDGDGYADFLVGSPESDDVDIGAGKVYFLSGINMTDGSYDITQADLQILGAAAEDKTGTSVSTAGDIDGDERFDFLIGAPFSDFAGNASGAVYLFKGATIPSGISSVSSADIIFYGENEVDLAGSHVGSAGDVDADGFDDLLIGAPYSDAGGNRSGKVYLFHGSDLSGISYSVSEASASFYGEGVYDEVEYATGVGDVDGDGLDDIVIGVPKNDDVGLDAGKTYLIYGASLSSLSLPLSLSDLAFVGELPEDQSGTTIEGCGDVTADGLDDFLVAAPGSDVNGNNSGKVYLITNSAMLSTSMSLSTMSRYFYGEAAGDEAGTGLSSINDLDGDGMKELLIGSPLNGEADFNAGKAYVYYSSDIGLGAHDLASSSLSYMGLESNNYVGGSVLAPGDLNNDGVKDLILGASGNNVNGANTGMIFVFLNPFE